MPTKRHFKKKTLLKKHKKSRLTKSRINKLVGGEPQPYTNDEINKFNNEILINLTTSRECADTLYRINKTRETLESSLSTFSMGGLLKEESKEKDKLLKLVEQNKKNMILVQKKQEKIDKQSFLAALQTANNTEKRSVHAAKKSMNSKSLANFFRLNEKVPEKKEIDVRQKLADFIIAKTISVKKNNTENLKLSFCDCKIILLYILAFDFFPDHKDILIDLIIQLPIEGIEGQDHSDDNRKLIIKTFQLIKKIFDEFKFIELQLVSCSEDDIFVYITNPSNKYNKLFNNPKYTILKIVKIFEKRGMYIDNDDNNALLRNTKNLQDIFI